MALASAAVLDLDSACISEAVSKIYIEKNKVKMEIHLDKFKRVGKNLS